MSAQHTPIENLCGRIEGRLATRSYLPGDALPATGSLCLISGANCDIESDQHRGYLWRQVLGFTDDDEFVCLHTPGCWPTVERTKNCWFAEIPDQRATKIEEANELLKHLQHAVRFFDQLTKADADRYGATIAKATGGQA